MRRLIAAALVTGVLLLAAGPAGATESAPSTATEIQLMSQTPWLQGPGLYALRVGFPTAAPTDRVQVTVFEQVRTRSDFDNDANGQVNGYHFFQQLVPLSSLPADGSGGLDIQLPVNRTAPPHEPFSTVQIGETGVFPVQVMLYDSSGRPKGTPLTTFIVFAQKAASAGSLKPLYAALVIPVSSQPVVGPNGGMGTPEADETARLQQLADVLNADSSVPASILASPLTLDELGAGGSEAGRSVLAELNGATAGGPFEVLPSSYAPVSLGDLQNSLPAEVDPQLTTGTSVLQSAFGTSPDGKTWVVDGPLDGPTLSVLIDHHAQQVIVPNGDLTPLPGEVQFTFAGSTYLDYAGSQLRVISADTTLTSAFTRNESSVLAANKLLAELAMIYTETPNLLSPRGLAVLPPAGWSPSPDFVQTLLNGLQGNPLVSAVTATQLFSNMGAAQGTRYLAPGLPASSPISNASAISGARDKLDELGQILGQSAQLAQLKKQLLMAESFTLSDRQRDSVLTAIGRATEQVQHVASLPPATTITLTSTKGQIPLTVLTAGGSHPRIQLHLRSQRLIFRPFSPREGPCTVLSDTDEVCVLSLTNQNTTLHVPVETRSSGVFPIDVYLEVPGTAKVLVHDRDTVRSTAVSGVAVIVIVVALAGLVLWWGRDLRRGRRPRGMVPSPVEVGGGEPAVDGFFDQPVAGTMSPSGAGAGPNPKNHQHGRARETRKM